MGEPHTFLVPFLGYRHDLFYFLQDVEAPTTTSPPVRPHPSHSVQSTSTLGCFSQQALTFSDSFVVAPDTETFPFIQNIVCIIVI